MLKAQFFEKTEQLGVAETAIGEDRHLRPFRQRLLEPAKAHVLDVVALSPQFRLEASAANSTK